LSAEEVKFHVQRNRRFFMEFHFPIQHRAQRGQLRCRSTVKIPDDSPDATSGNGGKSEDLRLATNLQVQKSSLPLTNLDVFKMARIIKVVSNGIKMTFGQLLSPCVLGHGNMLRTRDEEGRLALECVECGHVTRVLQQQAIKGPKHHAVPVPGAPVLTPKPQPVRERRYPRSA
jgi:hypothetical protein